MNSIKVQVPCGNVGVLSQIKPIIRVDIVNEQGESENIFTSVIKGNIEFGLVTFQGISAAFESL